MSGTINDSQTGSPGTNQDSQMSSWLLEQGICGEGSEPATDGVLPQQERVHAEDLGETGASKPHILTD